MKFRKLFSVIGLGLFAMATVGASAFALKNNEAKRAEAEAGDTWMFSVGIDATAIESAYTISNLRFHVWGTGVEKMVGLQETGKDHYYAAILSFTDAQTVTGGQFVFYQYDDQNSDKYSVDLSVAAEAAEQLSKTENNGIAFFFTSSTDWTDGKWGASRKSYGWPYAQMTGGSKVTLTADPVNRRYFASDFVCDERYVDILTIEWFNDGKSYSYLTTTAKSYSPSGADNWVYLELGTYDVVIEHQFNDDGIIDIKKHVNEYVGVYLVGIDEDVYVYTFGEGGIEDFDGFPGTRLGDIANAHRILTDIKFQGNEWEIWYLPLDYGYPEADHIILTYLNEHGNVGTQSADMLLSEGSAYWFSYDNDYHNDEAGLAIDFLCDAEEARKAATNESVCNVSKADATPIVNAYKGLSDTIKTTYINGTTVNTLKRDGSEGKEYVAYSLVMGEFARIAEISLGGTNSIKAISVNTPAFIIVVAVSAAFIFGLAIIFTAKKRQHN